MTCTLSIPLQIFAEVHEIDGGGCRAEVPSFPGCVVQAETVEVLTEDIVRAVDDWLNASAVKTEDEVRQLAEIQGSSQPVDGSLPPPLRISTASVVDRSGCIAVERRDIRERSGFVPPADMAIVNSKTAVRAEVIGGWP
jgi:predicted RNase H-like HicB family nuclease